MDKRFESGGDFLLIVFQVIGWIDDGDTILKPDTPDPLWQALEAPSLRQLFSAVSAHWNTKPSKVFRDTQFLVRVVRCRMVAKLDSIGLVVRI